MDSRQPVKSEPWGPETHILMFTLNAYPALVPEAYNAGIKDVISKSEGVGSHVLDAVRSVLAA
jgi:DNA-binding NarL/FixJ family response regulator